MRVLVTGAGGFSGSFLVPALLARGHSVTAVAGRSRGRLDPALDSNPALEVIQGDLSGALPLPLPDRIDALVHTAARSPAPGVTPLDMVQDNVLATDRLLKHTLAAGAKTCIYFSSLSVYGDITAPQVDEHSPCVNPDVYGMTKYMGELMLRDMPQLRSLSIRLPGVIGPRSVRNWLSTVVEELRAGRSVTYYNPDAPFNNAIHVADLCEFVGTLLDDDRWSGHDAVTAGAAGMTTVRKAIEMIVERLGVSSSLRIGDAKRPNFTISSERAIAYGYRPMEIEAMIRRFADENRD